MLFPLSRGLRSSFSRWCSSLGRCHLWFLVNPGRVDTHAVIWWPTSRVNLLGLVPFLADPCEAMWLVVSPLYTILVTSVTSDSSSLRSFVITVVFIIDGDVRFTPHFTLKIWRKNKILKPFQAPWGGFLHFIAASHKSEMSNSTLSQMKKHYKPITQLQLSGRALKCRGDADVLGGCEQAKNILSTNCLWTWTDWAEFHKVAAPIKRQILLCQNDAEWSRRGAGPAQAGDRTWHVPALDSPVLLVLLY